MTKAHYHRQFNFALDSVDDADIIERIASQPSQIAYLRNLIRRDIRYERENDKMLEEFMKMDQWHSRELEAAMDENAKLRELAQRMWRLERFGCYGCRQECDAESCYASECKEAIEIEQEMRELGVEVES